MSGILNISFLIMLVLTLDSCHYEKFDKNLWIHDDPAFYHHRRNMLRSIIDNKLFKDRNTAEVSNILGKPDWVDTTSTGKIVKLNYTVQLSYGFDIDPKFSKSLELEVDSNKNMIMHVRVKEGVDRRNLIEKIFTK